MNGYNARALERIMPVLAGEPAVDINSSAFTGDYFNAAKFRRVLVLVITKDGTATSGDITPALYQAKDASGTSAKVLNCLETGKIHTDLAADYATYAAKSTNYRWTAETQATADEQFSDDDSGEQCGILALDVRAEDLDADNDFDWIRCDVGATSSSKTITVLYIGLDPRQANSPDLMENPLV